MRDEYWSISADSAAAHWAKELINCPYCMSHYVAMFFVAIYRPMPLTGHWVDILASVFIIVTLSTFMVQAILLVARVLNVLKPYDPSQKSD